MTPSEHDRTIRYTLDGKDQESSIKEVSAAQVLSNGGLDPALYDLTQKRPGEAKPKAYADDDKVHLKDGDAFLSVRVRAEVA